MEIFKINYKTIEKLTRYVIIIISRKAKKGWSQMKKETIKNKKEKKKETKKPIDKGQIFVKIMAGVLCILMVAGTGVSLVYALMQ